MKVAAEIRKPFAAVWMEKGNERKGQGNSLLDGLLLGVGAKSRHGNGRRGDGG